MSAKEKSCIADTAPDVTTLFSKRANRWRPGEIHKLFPLEKYPGMISLLAGKPNPESFPFSEITISLKGPDRTKIVLDEHDLEDGLQYGLPGGSPGLVQWCEELQINAHGLRAKDGWGCCIGSGTQELIHKAFQVFTDPGDPVLIETPTYTGVAGFLRADLHEMVEVVSDSKGINPSHLQRILETWPCDRPRPTVLYTVPTGSNPTGTSCKEYRKMEILRLAKQFNFVILEDDAYYYLNFDKSSARSYLALETEVNGESGHVVRFDSLSKTVSAGMRLGVLTGPLPVVQKVVRIVENTSLQPSSTTQLLALALFRHWGHSGFLAHCERAATIYRRRRDMFIAAAERHLVGKALWTIPSAGRDSFEVMVKHSLECGILAIPGVAFMPNPRRTSYLRVSYSLVPENEIDEACQRIARLVDATWQERDKRSDLEPCV